MKQYTGMRKGLSLVEMIIAVILFAALSAISIKYYKNFFNTELTAKKGRVAALLDQGAQMSNAYDTYMVQVGTNTNLDINLTQLDDGNISILTKLPTAISGMATGLNDGTGAWEINKSTGITGSSGVALQYKLDMNTTNANQTADDEQYCAIINHEFNASIDFNVSNGLSNPAYFPTTMQNGYNRYGNVFCYNSGSYKVLIIVKP